MDVLGCEKGTNCKNSRVTGILCCFTCILFLCLFLFFESCLFMCLFIGMIYIWISSENLTTKVFSVLVMFLLMLLVLYRYISFDFIPQALDLLNVDTSLMYWIQKGHIHAVRLAIAYPAYIMHCMFSIELNRAFSYYCVIIFMLLFMQMCSVKEMLTKERGSLCSTFFILFCTVFLSFIMNGRICFAFLGYSILIKQMNLLFADSKPSMWVKRYAEIIIGTVLTTVSSGTMLVAILFLVAMFVFRIVKFKRIEAGACRLFLVAIFCSKLIIVGVKYVLKMIDKNITYFGGGIQGIINMLQHGVGKILGTPSNTMLIFLVCIGIVLVGVNLKVVKEVFYKANTTQFTAFIAFNIAFYGMFVGLSTGSLMLVPLIILFAGALDNKLNVLRKMMLEGGLDRIYGKKKHI